MEHISKEEIDGRIGALVQQRDWALHQAVMLSGRVADLEVRLRAMMTGKSAEDTGPDLKVVP